MKLGDVSTTILTPNIYSGNKKCNMEITAKFEMKTLENLWKYFELNYHVILLEQVILSASNHKKIYVTTENGMPGHMSTSIFLNGRNKQERK